jgi:hypothetical protein
MRFVETSIFTEDVTNLLSGEEYRGLQLAFSCDLVREELQ